MRFLRKKKISIFSELAEVFVQITQVDRRKLALVCWIQFLLSLLDLLSVVLVGAIGALAVNGISSRTSGERVQAVLTFLQIDGYSFQTQIAVLGVAASGLMIIRTVSSYFITQKTYIFLSNKSAYATNQLYSKIINSSINVVRDKNTHETLFALNHGMNLVFLGIVATTISVVTDFSLMLVLFCGLLLLDVNVAVFSIILFAGVLTVTFRVLQKKATRLGTINTQMSISANSVITESFINYRELFVTDRRDHFRSRLSVIKSEQASSTAKLTLMPYLSKYVIEGTMTLGTLAVCGLQFVLNDAVHAIATLSVFLAATTRIGPAAMRVQQGAIQIKGNLAQSKPTLQLIAQFKDVATREFYPIVFSDSHEGFNPQIVCEELTFDYTNSNNPIIKNISLTIKEGQHIAIVGSSGAGKTTLVDVILGVLTPTSGKVTISNQEPATVYKVWPGAVAYVPQEVLLISDSLRANILLGISENQVSDQQIFNALDIAQLGSFSRELPEGLNTLLGENGIRLSGGQRQRIGIARALLTNPKLLVLDEATSSMDGQTESEITEALRNLHGKVTIITIAHRLSTVRLSDSVLFMKQGKLVAQGSFDEVRQLVPDFNDQAKSMGL
jgi:ABC-type multidrug transport system fused ATPase/permease subunit